MNGRDGFREALSSRLVFWSTLALAGLGAIVMIGAVIAEVRSSTGGQVLQASQLLFSALLPLFGTWVGTILAYYYSKENFEAASRGTLDVVRNVVQRLQAVPVVEHMMPRARIVAAAVPAGKKLGDLVISDIEKTFDTIGANGQRISRLLIVDSTDACIGLLHRSTFTEMLAGGLQDKSVDPATDNLSKLIARPYPSPVGTTYADFIQKTVAYVAQDRTVADAKTAMEQLRGCQDVVVTRTGLPSGPMLGWISNIDIGRLSQA